MSPDRISLLSPRERECLRLVSRHFSSKEIAQQLGISHHTVDDHLKRAIATLGVGSRFEAARVVAEQESAPRTSPQPLGAQPQAIAAAALVSGNTRPDRTEKQSLWRTLPFLRNGRRHNDLSPVQRLTWIFIGAVAILFGLSQLANILNTVQNIGEGIAHGRH